MSSFFFLCGYLPRKNENEYIWEEKCVCVCGHMNPKLAIFAYPLTIDTCIKKKKTHNNGFKSFFFSLSPIYESGAICMSTEKMRSRLCVFFILLTPAMMLAALSLDFVLCRFFESASTRKC